MFIVLIKWEIIPGCEEKFENAWNTQFKLGLSAKDDLIGEYLSKADHPGVAEWVTYPLRNSNHATTYFNVGIWVSGEAFHRHVGHLFNENKPLEDFEYSRRSRVALNPVTWRIGNATFDLQPSDAEWADC